MFGNGIAKLGLRWAATQQERPGLWNLCKRAHCSRILLPFLSLLLLFLLLLPVKLLWLLHYALLLLLLFVLCTTRIVFAFGLVGWGSAIAHNFPFCAFVNYHELLVH